MSADDRSIPPVEGFTAPGFEGVRVEFARNLAERRELGGAVAAWRGDECLVDLWGGFRDRAATLPWERDTPVIVFSTTKGIASLALACLASRGHFDPDARVSELWPEFAEHGKDAITGRDLLAHRAGLIEPTERLDLAVLADPLRTAEIIARAQPAWSPGAHHGYHALSFGLYVAELVRRADPRGRTIGAFVREELARPLGEEFHIGLPSDGDDEHVAELVPLSLRELVLHPGGMPPGLLARLPFPWTLTRRSIANPRLAGLGELDRSQWRRVELASANGIGTARAVARLYAACAAPGGPFDLAERDVDALSAVHAPPPGGAHDLVLRAETSYSLGFFRPTRRFRFGTSARAFGMAGAGGSFGFADPDTGVGFGYVTNRMGVHLFADPREKALRDAVLEPSLRRKLVRSQVSTAGMTDER